MNPSVDTSALFLFVPADRPKRIVRALSAGADAIILDLEDAVAPGTKVAARQGIASSLPSTSPCPILIRVNAVATPWFEDDLSTVAGLNVAGVVLPKAESPGDMKMMRQRLNGKAALATVESAAGLSCVEAIAKAADRLAFGSIDFASDLGCAHNREALLFARSRIVLAARRAGKPAPIDGVTTALRDEQVVEADSRYAASLGFGGKLLIHPEQVGPARRGLAPSELDVAWAKRVLCAAKSGAAVAVDGAMVDAPVLARAHKIILAQDRSMET